MMWSKYHFFSERVSEDDYPVEVKDETILGTCIIIKLTLKKAVGNILHAGQEYGFVYEAVITVPREEEIEQNNNGEPDKKQNSFGASYNKYHILSDMRILISGKVCKLKKASYFSQDDKIQSVCAQNSLRVAIMTSEELGNEMRLSDLVGLLRTEMNHLAELYRNDPMFLVEEATVEVGINAVSSTTKKGIFSLQVVKLGGSRTEKSGHQCKLSIKLKPYIGDDNSGGPTEPLIGGPEIE